MTHDKQCMDNNYLVFHALFVLRHLACAIIFIKPRFWQATIQIPQP